MVVFPCTMCRTSLSAEESQIGRLVQCPTCQTTLRVPTPQPVAAVSSAPAGMQQAAAGSTATMTRPKPPQMRASPGKRYGFNCVYCSSRLEATESMAGEDGQCPTCGNQITIPILDRYNRLIDPKTREVIKQDPHPVHAYAAAGERAPKIDRDDTGVQHIICPKCRASSPISANNCRGCGVPFTLEGTSLDTGGNSNGLCVASLVLGILGLPMHVLILPSLLAVVLGLVGTQQVKRGTGSGSGLALAGMICGAIGLMLGAVRLVAG